MLLHTATPLAILKREILSSLLHCIDLIAYFSDEILKQAFKVQQFIRDETRRYQPFWPLTSYKKQCVVRVTCSPAATTVTCCLHTNVSVYDVIMS